MSSQSPSFNFPHRGSDSCLTRYVVKAALYLGFERVDDGDVMRSVRLDMAVGNAVTKGLYKARYGKWERSSRENEGDGSEERSFVDAGEGITDVVRRIVSDEKNER